MKYDIYLNRRKMKKDGRRVYSIRGCTGKYKARVRWINEYVLLSNAGFVVREAGRLETLKRISTSNPGMVSAKTVHAFIRGSILYRGRNALMYAKILNFLEPTNDNIEVSYNPIINDSFVDNCGSPIRLSPIVFCSPSSVIAVTNPTTVDVLKAIA